ncbi:hypothetical protein [Planktothrix mougeotii]|uniref:DUF2281 domain-containing protein n=1 Tax=Planktothrix mougeotii LEGE 06226 TaxID=1828728 RepID=A0ABR9UA32_9CYAN|nr:hypothetical protein [Planktothrix mougeotii]MBE9143298.1 hypothetical protein [Planktothrix mougeotii LEGE 06226]
MNVTDIRNQVKQYIDQLSPEKLRVAADFLSYLAERENQEKTEELLKTSEFKESLEQVKEDILEEQLISFDKQKKRKVLINILQGKYAHASTSSEDFAQQKQKEIDWEERNQ